jgi:hypothetical protein
MTAMSRSLWRAVLTVLAVWSFSGAVRAEGQLSTLNRVAVRIEKPVGDGRDAYGSGVFVNGSTVLTAAHVVAFNRGDPRVRVLVDGRVLGATIARDGSAANVDLALLRLDEAQPGIPELQVCNDNPAVSARVLVAAMGTVTQTRTINAPLTSKAQSVGTWTNLLERGYFQGNSGGGVFDLRRGCLWGVLTQVMTGPSLAQPGQTIELTAMAPALEVSAFLGAAQEK